MEMVVNERYRYQCSEYFSMLSLQYLYYQIDCLLKCLISILQKREETRKSLLRSPIVGTSIFI